MIQVVGWQKFQHYKGRRPPWIKLYRDLLDKPEWHALSGDASKLLTECWLIAAEHENGAIPLDVPGLAWRLRRNDHERILALLQEVAAQGFIALSAQSASAVLAPRKRPATPEKRRVSETENKRPPQSPPIGGLIAENSEEGSWRRLRDLMLTRCLLGRDEPRGEDDFGMGLLVTQARWMIDHRGVQLEDLIGVVTDLRRIVGALGHPLGPAERCSLAIFVHRAKQGGEFTGTEDWSFWEMCRHEWLKSQSVGVLPFPIQAAFGGSSA